MSSSPAILSSVSAALRTARRARGLSIAQLAARAEVSPRLVSEFERGLRPHVSLDTAIRLLRMVGVSLTVDGDERVVGDEADRRARAELRRRTWVGSKTTLAMQRTPIPPSPHAERLTAVARASLLAVGLQTAYRNAQTQQAPKRAR